MSCDGGGTGDDHDHHHQGQGQGQGGNGSGAGKAHLFCRECLLANLLAQRTEIKRQRAQQEREAAEAAEEAARRAEEDRRRVVAEFELTQAGLAVGKGGERRPEESKEDQGSSITTASGQTEGSKLLEAGNSSKKRKLEIDESVVSKIARADQEKARRAIEAEKVGCCRLFGATLAAIAQKYGAD